MIRLALPAGDLRTPVADMLSSVGLEVEGYGEGSRAYRLAVRQRDDVLTRIFRERDIPIQVALGNYDLGICSLTWVKEMAARFPQQPLIPLFDLGIGRSVLYACADSHFRSIADLGKLPVVRIASEYPAIAEAFALAARFRSYRVQATWGSAHGYPPEDADVAVVSGNGAGGGTQDLISVHRLLDSSAWLIVNRESLAGGELASVLGMLMSARAETPVRDLSLPDPVQTSPRSPPSAAARAGLRIAVPDGHQQRHAVQALADAGLRFEGYDDVSCIPRPASGLENLSVKVVRPHDMPQLAALRHFDLAITGRDCLLEHLHRFPSSPVVELVDLQRGQYNLSAVVSEDLEYDNIDDALTYWRSTGKRLVRIASEFMATADYYARSRRLWRYQVIPIAGASEGFVPEDAELLIEGTETGRTLRENRLKTIDLLYRSTTCLIGHASPSLSRGQRELMDELQAAFSASARPA
jgi:ATP phosphoribosyltransferase